MQQPSAGNNDARKSGADNIRSSGKGSSLASRQTAVSPSPPRQTVVSAGPVLASIQPYALLTDPKLVPSFARQHFNFSQGTCPTNQCGQSVRGPIAGSCGKNSPGFDMEKEVDRLVTAARAMCEREKNIVRKKYEDEIANIRANASIGASNGGRASNYNSGSGRSSQGQGQANDLSAKLAEYERQRVAVQKQLQDLISIHKKDEAAGHQAARKSCQNGGLLQQIQTLAKICDQYKQAEVQKGGSKGETDETLAKKFKILKDIAEIEGITIFSDQDVPMNMIVEKAQRDMKHEMGKMQGSLKEMENLLLQRDREIQELKQRYNQPQ